MIDERTEQLINRRLDGELDDESLLELNKRLIRSPEARLTLEAYERNDALASDALRSWRSPAPQHEVSQAARSIAQQRGWFSRIGVGVRAVAAALLLVTAIGLPSYWRTPAPVKTTVPTLASIGPAPSPLPRSVASIDGPREERHQLQRHVVGVWDEATQSVYVLELDQHARTVVPVAMNF
jgi:hypothetical protein